MTASANVAEVAVVELRQYLLRPGRRDDLITLFEREFIESQEALGMKLFGLFCDAARPDYFIWLRGFRDMDSRRDALERFYGGPVWKAHGNAANETMVDSDNVLLLRPARAGERLRPRRHRGSPSALLLDFFVLHRCRMQRAGTALSNSISATIAGPGRGYPRGVCDRT